MRIHRWTTFAALIFGAAHIAAGQTLTCTGTSGASVQNCNLFHYHYQAWRPDTKAWVELYGVNRFASTAACDAARAAEIQRNQAIIQHVKRIEPKAQFETNRFGLCHCDQTDDKSSPNFLDFEQRQRQLRSAEEIKSKSRDRLHDFQLKNDSELIRSMYIAPATGLAGSWSRTISVPEAGASTRISSVTLPPLKDTTVNLDMAKGPSTSDLPLVDIDVSKISETQLPSAAESEAGGGGAASDAAATEDPRATPNSPEPFANPEIAEAADRLINFETARVQNVLKANENVTDEELRGGIFQASMQRLQLLSNMRPIIEGSAHNSRLATAVRGIKNEEGRLELVRKMFGDSISKHWAPRDAREIILTPPPGVADDPVAAIRDSSGRFSVDDRKVALYLFLANNSSITPNQELWLAGVIEEFLSR